MIRIALLFALTGCSAAVVARTETHPGQHEFARELAREVAGKRADLDRKTIEAVLDKAVYQQSIIDAISRPAEATKPWRDYRPIFMTERRLADGIAFYGENAKLLNQVSSETGVPAELIVAILGVETNYGRITGKYRVIDALSTLAFHYPPRSPFFRGELKQLFLLEGDTFPYDLTAIYGSYAGAMGWGQFMPTSWANYARDGDADGRIDLWSSKPDIVASVANYFVGHGWESGQPVAVAATASLDARKIEPANVEPVYSVAQLAEWGYTSGERMDPNLAATLLRLDGAGGDEFWITHKNFWVITRYNRSPLYSMAVYQLAQAIAAGRVLATAPTGG